MTVRWLSTHDLTRAGLNDFENAVHDIRAGFELLHRGEAVISAKPRLQCIQGRQGWTVYIGFLGAHVCRAGVKWLTRIDQAGRPGGTIEGVLLLSDGLSGNLLAVVQAGALTAVRTAATSVFASLVFEKPDAKVLSILGAGVQAEYHIRCFLSVRPQVDTVLVWNRTRERVQQMSARLEPVLRSVKLLFCDNLRDAVSRGDIVVCAASFPEPRVDADWITPGTLVIDVTSEGACHADVIRRADRVYLDWRGNDVANAYKSGADVTLGQLAGRSVDGDLADIVDQHPIRRHNERLFFASEGVVIEDLSVCSRLFDRAENLGIGAVVPMTGQNPFSTSH